jgi:hypothetical protein
VMVSPSGLGILAATIYCFILVGQMYKVG